MNKSELGKELKYELTKGYDITRISKWAYNVYSNNLKSLDSETLDLLISLFSMEDDPQFEYTENQLNFLANQLINEAYLYNCRICGLNLGFEPWTDNGACPTHEICPCCGADFGYDDETPAIAKKYRDDWLKKGASWFCPNEKPENWSLEKQLTQIPKDFR